MERDPKDKIKNWPVLQQDLRDTKEGTQREGRGRFQWNVTLPLGREETGGNRTSARCRPWRSDRKCKDGVDPRCVISKLFLVDSVLVLVSNERMSITSCISDVLREHWNNILLCCSKEKVLNERIQRPVFYGCLMTLLYCSDTRKWSFYNWVQPLWLVLDVWLLLHESNRCHNETTVSRTSLEAHDPNLVGPACPFRLRFPVETTFPRTL